MVNLRDTMIHAPAAAVIRMREMRVIMLTAGVSPGWFLLNAIYGPWATAPLTAFWFIHILCGEQIKAASDAQTVATLVVRAGEESRYNAQEAGMSKKKQVSGGKAGPAAKGAAPKQQFPKTALIVRRPPRHQGR